jgi:hypothetical protein
LKADVQSIGVKEYFHPVIPRYDKEGGTIAASLESLKVETCILGYI